jgi:hypothetical protein
MLSLGGKHPLLEFMVFLVNFASSSLLFAGDDYSGIDLALQTSILYGRRKLG